MLFLWRKSYIFSRISPINPVFSSTWSCHSMLICCTRNISYYSQCLKQLYCLISLVEPVYVLKKKEKCLFEMDGYMTQVWFNLSLAPGWICDRRIYRKIYSVVFLALFYNKTGNSVQGRLFVQSRYEVIQFYNQCVSACVFEYERELDYLYICYSQSWVHSSFLSSFLDSLQWTGKMKYLHCYSNRLVNSETLMSP